MTLSDAASLLHELRERGVDLEIVGNRLRFRPPELVRPEVRERLAACKPAILALLHEEADAGDGEKPSVERCGSCGEPDFVRPRIGGTWRCARCKPYDLPGSEIEWLPRVEEPFVSLDMLLGSGQPTGSSPATACSCCSEANWWRLKPAGPWVCARCHPPLPAPDLIETIGGPAP